MMIFNGGSWSASLSLVHPTSFEYHTKVLYSGRHTVRGYYIGRLHLFIIKE